MSENNVISFICLEFPSPTLNHTGFSSVFWLCNQKSTLRNEDVTKMQAFLLACILSAVMEKQTGRSGKLLSSVNRSPGSGWTSCGGGGAKPKSGHSHQRYRDTPELELATPLLWLREGKTERTSAASHTQTFGCRATSLPFFWEFHLSTCSAKLQDNADMSAVDLPAYSTKITFCLKAKWKVWEDRQTERKH